MAKIALIINGEITKTDKYSNIDVSYNQEILDVVVWVDESDALNQFGVKCDSNWVEVKRNRNQVTLVVKKNIALEERAAIVTFTHNLDSDTFIRLAIVQAKAEYTIGAKVAVTEGDDVVVTPSGDQPHDSYTIMFNTLLDSDTDSKESVAVTVKATGGYDDFTMKPTIEYVRNAGEGNATLNTTIGYWPNSVEGILEDNYYMSRCDGGLKIRKVNANRIEITNYGKVSLYDKCFYVVKLYHVNDVSKLVELRIGYISSNVNNGSGFEFGDGE